MRTWLSEKDSQARDLATVLGNARKINSSTYETSQGLVTAASGHLYVDYLPQEYNPDWSFRMGIAPLPYLPRTWKQKPRTEQQRRITEIQAALRSASEVVIATDAGPEGERIARNLIRASGYRGPLKRLWLKALDPDSIRKALAQIADGKESEGLYEAAVARSKSDWLVGMNFSVLCTLLNQTFYKDSPKTDEGKFPTLQIGRVKTPTAKLVVDRDNEIENFRPQDFYHLQGTLYSRGQNKNVILKYHPPDRERIFEPQIAATLAQALARQTAPLQIENETKAEAPKLPFDLLELQKECNRRWSWSAERTLETAQSLYDTHKLTTYPRTDSRYLPEEQIPEIPLILKNAYRVFGQPRLKAVIERDGKPVIRKKLFNTAKVGEHNAIVPTTKEPDLAQLNSAELQLYLLVLCRYLENLSPDHEYTKTTVSLTLTHANTAAEPRDYPFKSIGRTPLKRGWLDVAAALSNSDQTDPATDDQANEENQKEEDTIFPPLEAGAPSFLDPIQSVKQTTKPPQHFTEATLLDAMRRIHEYEPDPVKKKLLKDKDIPGIGTPATRSKIIEELKRQDYLVIRNRKELWSTSKAKQMVRLMNDHFPNFVSISTTALWQEKIQRMEKPNSGIKHQLLVDEVTTEIQHHVEQHRANILARSSQHQSADFDPTPTGHNDPANNQPILQNKFCYLYPSKPNLRIPKVISHRTITIEEYNEIFATGKKFLTGFKSKAEKLFDCFLAFDPPPESKKPAKKDDKPPQIFRFVFPTQSAAQSGNAVPSAPAPTGVFYKDKEFFDHGDYWKCEAIEGFFRKKISNRDIQLTDYLAIFSAKKEGVTYEFISSKTNKPYTAKLVYSKKTKFNGKPGVEMVFEK